MPGFPVLHHLLEVAQIHVHWVGDAIQPSSPLLPHSPTVFYISQHQVFSSELAFCIRCPKYWSFSFSISPSNEYSNKISLRCKQIDLRIPLVNLNLRHWHLVEVWKVKSVHLKKVSPHGNIKCKGVSVHPEHVCSQNSFWPLDICEYKTSKLNAPSYSEAKKCGVYVSPFLYCVFFYQVSSSVFFYV